MALKTAYPNSLLVLSYRDSSRKRQSRRKNELLLLSRYDNSPVGYNGSVVKYKEKIALYFLKKGIQARRLEYGNIIGFGIRPVTIPSTPILMLSTASFMKHKGVSRSQYLTGETMEIYRRKPKIESSKGRFGSTKHLSDQLQSCNLSKNSTLLLRALLLGERQEFPQDLRSYFSAARTFTCVSRKRTSHGSRSFFDLLLFFPSLFSSLAEN